MPYLEKHKNLGLQRMVDPARACFDRRMFTYLFALCVLLGSAAISQAEVNFTAAVDRNQVALGEQIQLTLQFENAGNVNPQQLQAIDGFTIQYVGPQQQISIVNGVQSQSISHVYLLTPTREGTLTIPAFNVQLDGKAISSQPIEIKVSRTSSSGINVDDLFLMKLETPRQELFLNEVFPVDLKLYIRSGLRYESQVPNVSAEGFSELKLSRPAESQEVIQGKSFVVYTFRTLTSPMRLGELTLGPGQTVVDLYVDSQGRRRAPFGFSDPFLDGFFGRGGEKKRFAINSKPLKVSVKALPENGRPESFTGAIGRFALDVAANPTTLRAGEPVTLTIRVVGQGNLSTISPPAFTPPEGFKSYEPVVKSKQTDELGLSCEKTFEQVIVPLSSKASAIPPIVFSYFDPEKGSYTTLGKPAIPLRVMETPAGNAPVVVGVAAGQAAPRPPEKLGSGIVYLKPDLGTMVNQGTAIYAHPLFLSLQGVPVLALVGAFLFKRRRDKLNGDVRYARARRAYSNAERHLSEAEKLLNNNDPKTGFYAAIFKTMQDYLGDRLNLPSSGITAAIVEEQLRPHGVAPDVCEGVRQIFTDCDTARFAPSAGGQDRPRTLKLTREVIAAIEKSEL